MARSAAGGAWALVGLAACGPDQLTLPVVDGARTVVVVQREPRLVYANDLSSALAVHASFEPGADLEALFFAETAAAIGVVPGQVMEVDPSAAHRGLPKPISTFATEAGDGGPEVWMPTAAGPEVYLPLDTPASCVARGGCYARLAPWSHGTDCVAPCDAPVPPADFEVHPPTGLGPCPPGWAATTLSLALGQHADVCEPFVDTPAADCSRGMLRIPGTRGCEPITPCPSTRFGPGIADAYVAEGANGDGTEASPYGTINEAVSAAKVRIAVAAGRYVEDLEPLQDLELFGTCPSEVEVVGGIRSQHAVAIRDLMLTQTTTASPLLVAGAALTIEGAEVAGTVDDDALAGTIRRSVLGTILVRTGVLGIESSQVDVVQTGPSEVRIADTWAQTLSLDGEARVDRAAVGSFVVHEHGGSSADWIVIRPSIDAPSNMVGRFDAVHLWSQSSMGVGIGGRLDLDRAVLQGFAGQPGTAVLSIANATVSASATIIEGLVNAYVVDGPKSYLTIEDGLLVSDRTGMIALSGSSRLVARNLSLHGGKPIAILLQHMGGDLPDRLESIEMTDAGQIGLSGGRISEIVGLRTIDARCGVIVSDVHPMVADLGPVIEDLELGVADGGCPMRTEPMAALTLGNGITRVARFRIRGGQVPGARIKIEESYLEDGDYGTRPIGISTCATDASLPRFLARSDFSGVERPIDCSPF